MKNFNSFSILIWANKAKSDVKGLVPLYVRITVMGQRAEISLKKKVNPQKWDAKTGFMKGSGNEVRTIDNHIHQVSEEIFGIYSELQKTSDYILPKRSKINSMAYLMSGDHFCKFSTTTIRISNG